ncbi:FluG domain-containing protein [Apiospora aurea]|uniref:FluG domain-containing protein n=1 Tax=Apiospora aurea TaxID=335848 RepID=A0ABR1QYB3_9PEZI
MAPTRSRPVLQGPHQGFVNEFIHREQQNRVSKGPKSLTATQHAALRKQLQEVRFLKPAWADETKINVARILRKWKIFCRDVVNGPWKAVLEQADRATAMDFLLHMCETYRIKSLGTSWEYYRQYKQLYASVNGRHIDTNDNKEILKWHDATLVPHFKLRPPNVDGKPVVNSDGVFALLVFNIAYDDGIFASERQRINLLGIYQALAYTGARPGELVDNETHKPSDGSWEDLFASKCSTSSNEDNNHAPDEFQLLENILARETTDRGRPKALCYEDIRLMVVRHPETGQDMFSMAVKFIHHKGMDNNPKPTIFWFTMTRKLIYNFINVIICLALCDDAFDAPSLTTVRRVFQVKNAGPVKCTALRWKKEWLKRPVFRVGDEVVRYHKLRDDLKRQSLDMGNEESITPKAFRRGNANAMNRKAPDAVRDQALRHDPKWATFNSAYINENIEFDTQNAFLDEPTEDALINLFTHVGMTRDPRARRKMVPKQVWESLPPDPEIEALKQRREMLKAGRYRYKGQGNEEEIRVLSGSIRTKQAQRVSNVEEQYRQYFFYNRPTWDIERQVAGEEELEELEEAWQPEIDLQIPERAELAEAFLFQPEVPNFEDMLESCIHAVDVMFRLCQKRETPRRTRIHKRAQVQPNITDATPLDRHIFPLLMLKTQCPRCIGDGRLSYQERTFTYSRPAVMNDHFERAHVRKIRDLEHDKLIFCEHPTCVEEGVKLDDLDHFRNHVQTVHGVWLRSRISVG